MTTITFNPDGSMSFIGADEALAGELHSALGGQRVRRRASHVEPVGLAHRLAFRILRRFFGEHGRVAAWTRSWRGPWRVDLRPSDGPVLGESFNCRGDAIEAELWWLQENL